MKKLARIILSVITISSILSCSYNFERGDRKNINEDQLLSDNSSLSYKKINDLVLAPRCLGCHSGKDEPRLATYGEVFANKDEIFRQVIASNRMPKGKPLAESQIKALKQWLDAGAPETATDEVPVSNPDLPQNADLQRPVLWEQVRTKIFERSCTSCHYQGNADGISSYEDYETVKATIGTIFYTVAIQPVMPPAPSDWPEDQPNPNQLTREQKDLISAWITDGMLEK